jgi:multiple sugar transport system substrate-binding protein
MNTNWMIVVWMASSAFLSLFLIGCSGGERPAEGRVTITFWHSFVSSTVPALNELIQAFEQENPGIAIRAQYVPTGDALVQKLITAVQSNTAPDISWIHGDFLPDLVQADAIYKVDEFLTGPDTAVRKDLNDIYPALLQAASWKGILYSVPMEATNMALIYNKGLFRKVGLDPGRPPQNWDELELFAKKLTVDDDKDGKLDQVGFFVPVFPASGPWSSWMVWQWLPFLWQAGGYNINEEQTRVLFDGDAGVRALTLYKRFPRAQPAGVQRPSRP